MSKENLTLRVIAYTDGGCRPPIGEPPGGPGISGSGVHGYAYRETTTKPLVITNQFVEQVNEGKNEAKPRVTPTTAGYQVCGKKGELSEGAVAVTVDHYFDLCQPHKGMTTGNRAELYAVKMLLEEFEDKDVSSLDTYMDSQYALLALSKTLKELRAANWLNRSGEPMKNKELIESTLEIKETMESKGTKIRFHKVKAHSGDFGNEASDFVATVAITKASRGVYDRHLHIDHSSKAWTPDTDRHPLITGSRIIFNRKAELNDHLEVLSVDPAAKDLMIGKRDHEGYSIVKLKTPDESYSYMVDSVSVSSMRNEAWPLIMRTDRLYDKFVQRYLRAYGVACLSPYTNAHENKSINFLDKSPIAVEHNPPILIYRVNDIYIELKERLAEYTKEISYPEGEYSTKYFDITDHFYSTNTKGKPELHKELGVGVKRVTVVVSLLGKQVSVMLHLGNDLPDRNNLKRLEKSSPKITLLIWKTDGKFHAHATVLECADGVGIWANYHCNKLIV